MKRVISAVIIFSFFLSVATADFYSFGRSVTANLVLHIGNSDDDDIISSTYKYISVEDSDRVLALVSENAFGTVAERYTDDYSLAMRLPLNNNRFFLVFTRGDNKTISEKELDTLPQNRFGELAYAKPLAFPLFLRLEYYGIDLVNKARLIKGARELLIKNEGGIWMEVLK
jgi:hypothetical protein